MSDNKRKVDVWLYDCNLTDDANDNVGRVRNAGVINNKGIAGLIKKEGSEYQVEAITEILNRADRVCIEAITDGYTVHTDFVHARLGIKGVFTDQSFDPNKQSIKAVVTPTSALREAIKDLPVQVMGKATVGPVILKVTDSLTSEVNGTITPNNVLRITGDKIQVEGDNPDVGVYFVNMGDDTKTKVTQIISNKKKELIVMIPTLTAGDYHLEVVTQFSGGKTLIKEPRTERLEDVLTVV